MKTALLVVMLVFGTDGHWRGRSGTVPVCYGRNTIEYAETIKPAFQKLHSVQTGTDSVFVIVHFGDSHVQIGHFSGRIKENIQSVFGNSGDGFLFPYSACGSFGPASLKTECTGAWEWGNVLRRPDLMPLGIEGYGLKTGDAGAGISFRFVRDDEAIRTVTILHGANDYAISASVPEGSCAAAQKNEIDSGGWEKTVVSANGPLSSIHCEFRKTDAGQKGFTFYGIEFDNGTRSGVRYHQCGVVGARFTQLIEHAPLLVSQLGSLHPDLIIFSYGTNESYAKDLDDAAYCASVESFIERLKTEMPAAGILFTTAPDTRRRSAFPVRTRAVNCALRNIARKTRSALWDLNAVMGGDYSMYRWHDRGLAMNDLVHFKKTGYTLQADLLSLAFFESYNRLYLNSINTGPLQLEIMTIEKGIDPGPPQKGHWRASEQK